MIEPYSNFNGVAGKLSEWLGHMRECDNRQQCQEEVCRLTFDQAMLLCFEMDAPYCELREKARMAYRMGRPWDLLRDHRVWARLVPYEVRK